MTRQICAVTGTRADYGHLHWILQTLESDSRCDLTVVATGAHFSERHGATVHEVSTGGYKNIVEVDIGLDDDSPIATTRSLAKATERLAETFERLSADLILILGDRYEILGAAQAALIQRIPVAHIHGGEITEGAFDDAIRHAVTKLSHLHFAAAEPYARRIRQMGENPAHVYAFGAPGLDDLEQAAGGDLEEIAAFLKTDMRQPILLVTYHPETLGDTAEGAAALVDALARFADRATIIFTGVNADPGHRRVSEIIEAFAERQGAHVATVASLGRQRYLTVMNNAAAIVGNSSSGLIEAPALGKPTVNIGTRQAGRLRADSVIDCPADADAIATAIETALTPAFQNKARDTVCPYGNGGASKQIAEVLATAPLEALTAKRFHDLATGDA